MRYGIPGYRTPRDLLDVEINRILELGDIEINISNVDFTNKFIFERKTLTDLNASINDGRYKEQKHRLLSSYSNNAITYIIEGDDIHKSINRNDKKISSSYFNTLYELHKDQSRDISLDKRSIRTNKSVAGERQKKTFQGTCPQLYVERG